MVGIIHRVASIEGMLRYNEQKIDAGVAQCIGQGNFPISHNRLSFTMKLNMLKRNVALRPRKKPAIHIFLSFSPAEKIVNKKMVKIAETYIDRKSTRLNSSHVKISYAVFCLKKKNNIT